MSTPCCQISTPNRLVVSEYEVPKVLVSRKWGFFIETPGIIHTLNRTSLRCLTRRVLSLLITNCYFLKFVKK